ncbi:DUF6370 family protein [Pedobacter gandavensis]|uniref:Glutaminyl-tRNA synthetase n=1 Tax=Pedobacter gandavensis TaxID=2679963 RepID=A0ABR6F019_9SPHI|nr:DUF6370 family protein [Pedobacter gandavensis]MBB2150404.1 hypothetical protein [Pedobacter gandavensis]
MKKFITLMFFAFLAIGVQAQQKTKKEPAIDFKTPHIVETACGECKFGLKGKECDLAVRIDGHAYFVDGTDIDDHGDAHAKDGFCNKIRKAEVTGKVVNGRFKASFFNLLKDDPAQPNTKI